MKDNRTGSAWMQTYTGRQAWPDEPRASDIHLGDVAHQLALINRFLGATCVPYSVAEHSVRCARWVETTFRRRYSASMEGFDERLRLATLAALVHDVSEYVFGDMPRPLKRVSGMWWYRDREERFQRVVEAWVGLPVGAVEWSIVKEADLVMLATEKRDLLAPSVVPWGPLPPPDAGEIVPWDWLRAEEAFREEFERLYVDRGPVALAHFHHCPGCCQSMPCRERCTIEGELSENGVETGAHIACSPACEKVIAERDAEHERGAAQADGTRASP